MKLLYPGSRTLASRQWITNIGTGSEADSSRVLIDIAALGGLACIEHKILLETSSYNCGSSTTIIAKLKGIC
jgi:hypothetical protein